MRVAIRCSARLLVASRTTLHSPICRGVACSSLRNNAFPVAQRARLASSASAPQTKRQLKKLQKSFQVSDTKDPKSFVTLYDEFLPPDIRSRDGRFLEQSQYDLQRIMAIEAFASKAGKVDLWVWMAQNGYRRQLVHILNRGLTDLATKSLTEKSTPSNIDWPDTIFDDLHYNEKPLEISLTQSDKVTLDTLTNDQINTSALEKAFLSSIWLTLTKLVLASSEAPSRSQDSPSMRAALLILAAMHNLDLLPKDIYSYKPLNLSSTVTRPPIIHLFSSRILASLSDATWREQQDEAIAQATLLGHSLKHISENAPGGRFRLKVQPLPVELWLELILWCCVGGGDKTTAYKIVNMLHHSEDPWFAVRWCSTQTSPLAETLVDWNRVKLRHGGVVGRIEGYSREKPFADVPEKTISAEVVLALIEAFATGNIKSSSFNKISDLLHFLEPHDLPPSYFDYLQSRLLFAGWYEVKDPSEAQARSEQFTSFRSLKPMKEVPRAVQTLELDSVLDHSLLHIGVMQQSLDALVGYSAVHNALELFNHIQEQVDQNKLQSIEEFVQKETHFYRLEYADSHGQLPRHRLAAFLDLATEAKMLGLGEWLLYSDDLDDSLIPSNSYSTTCLAPSLTRFASANGDDALLARIHANFDAKYTSSKQRPSVRTYRAFFDADIESLNLRNLVRYLSALKGRGARIGLTNYAYLASTILRIEKGDVSGQPISRQNLHRQAVDLLDKMLSGQFFKSTSSETLIQKMQYKQQVSHILRVFAQCEDSSLKDLAIKYAPEYASGNNVLLFTRVFNVLLDGISTAYGAVKGREIYESFCRRSVTTSDQLEPDFEDVHYVSDITEQENTDYEQVDTAEDFVESFFPANQDIAAPEENTKSTRFLRSMPITVPQASTLRIIIRAALAQKGVDNGPIVDWAITQFPLIGTQTLNVIAQEIQRPLTEVDLQNIRLLKYQLSQDYHALATEDESLLQARIEHVARRTQERRKDERIDSLWSEYIPTFQD